MNYILTIIMAVFLLSSCKKEVPNSTQSATDWYPMAIGNYWMYERFNLLNNVTDTITITVIEENASLSNMNGLWKLQQTNNTGSIEVNYFMRYSTDSLVLYKSYGGNSYNIFYTINFSKLKEGATFNGYEVLSMNADLNAYNISFNNPTALLYREYYGFNSYQKESLYLTKNIGLTVRENLQYDLGPTENEKIVLINYHLE